MRKSILLGVLVLVSLVSFTGCFTPVKNEIPLVKGDLHMIPANTNDTKLIIFNDSNP